MIMNLRINFGNCKVINSKKLNIKIDLQEPAKYIVETKRYRYYFDSYKDFVNKFIALTRFGIDCTCKTVIN